MQVPGDRKRVRKREPGLPHLESWTETQNCDLQRCMRIVPDLRSKNTNTHDRTIRKEGIGGIGLKKK